MWKLCVSVLIARCLVEASVESDEIEQFASEAETVEIAGKKVSKEDLASFQKLQALEKQAAEMQAQVKSEKEREARLRIEAESLRAQAALIKETAGSGDKTGTIAEAEALLAEIRSATTADGKVPTHLKEKLAKVQKQVIAEIGGPSSAENAQSTMDKMKKSPMVKYALLLLAFGSVAGLLGFLMWRVTTMQDSKKKMSKDKKKQK